MAKAGRPKGSKDRVSQRARSAIASLIDQDFTQKDMQRLIRQVERESGAKDAFGCYVQLLEYCLPKLARVEHAGDQDNPIGIEHILNSLGYEKNNKALTDKSDDGIIEQDYERIIDESV